VNLAFRSISDADRDFLSRVYASTHEQEKELFGWEDKKWQDFLKKDLIFLGILKKFKSRRKQWLSLLSAKSGRLDSIMHL